MLLCIVPNDAFRREIEANARRGGLNPETWLSAAVSQFAKVLGWLKDGDGILGVGKGDEIMRCEDLTLEKYRRISPLRVVPGISPEELGGYPLGTLIWRVDVDDELAKKLLVSSGASSTYEAIGYAIWRQARFANTLREDYPDWEPGIILSDGIFRSLAVRGAMRRLPGSTFDPVVPRELPIGEKTRAWVRALSDSDVHAVDLAGASPTDPLFWQGLLHSGLDRRSSRDGPTSPSNQSKVFVVPASVLEIRPLIEAFLLGPSPDEARCVVVTKRPSHGGKREELVAITMPDLLYDPAPLLELRALLARHLAKALVVSAGVVGCGHRVLQRRPIDCCPGWRTPRGSPLSHSERKG